MPDVDDVTVRLKGEAGTALDASNKVTRSLLELHATALKVSAGITVVGFALRQALSYFREAAQAEESMQRLNRQVAGLGVSADMLTGSLKKAAGGQLSLADATRLASRALAQNIPVENLETITKLAKVAANVLGRSLPEANQELIMSLATGRTRMLSQIGVIIDLEAAKKKLADQTGRTTAEITRMEERQLLLTEVMRQAPAVIAKFDTAIDSTSDHLNRATAGVKDLWDSFLQGALHATVAVLDFNVALGKKVLTPTRMQGPGLGSATGEALLGPTAFMAGDQIGIMLRTKHLAEQNDKLQDMAKWLGVSTDSLRMMTDAEKAAFVIRASLRDQVEDLAEGTDAYSLILRDEADALIKSAEAAKVAMRAEDDHARLLKMETDETKRLIEATNVLSGLRASRVATELTRGEPEDAFRRIRQEAFSGTGGDTLAGVQSLIATTQSVQGGDAGDRDRLLRDLTDRLERLATFTVNAGTGPGIPAPFSQEAFSPAPFGPGSQVIQPSSQAFGESVGAFGLRQPVATQPVATQPAATQPRIMNVGDIIIQGSDNPRETAKQVREELLRLEAFD